MAEGAWRVWPPIVCRKDDERGRGRGIVPGAGRCRPTRPCRAGTIFGFYLVVHDESSKPSTMGKEVWEGGLGRLSQAGFKRFRAVIQR